MLGADAAARLIGGFHKGLMPMKDSFSALITQVTHALGAEMDASRRRRAIVDRIKALTVLALDLGDAEIVGCGSRILPEPANPEVDWFVLARNEHPDLPAAALYSFSGIIPAAADAEAFVAQAYLCVLRRPVDEGGLENYGTRLTTGVITRRSVLRSLANSREARDKGVTVLIVPEPALWLATPDEPA